MLKLKLCFWLPCHPWQGRNLCRNFCSVCAAQHTAVMSTPTVPCQSTDEMARERTDHLQAEAKKLNSIALQTLCCIRASLTPLAWNLIFLNYCSAWNNFSKFFSRQHCYDDIMNILGITLQSFWILWLPPKNNLGEFFWGCWGVSLENHYAQFNFTRQITVEKFPASITNYMDLFWLVDWEHGVLWECLTYSLTYLFCRLV